MGLVTQHALSLLMLFQDARPLRGITFNSSPAVHSTSEGWLGRTQHVERRGGDRIDGLLDSYHEVRLSERLMRGVGTKMRRLHSTSPWSAVVVLCLLAAPSSWHWATFHFPALCALK